MAVAHTITHLIVELKTGGAETSLLRLLRATQAEFQHRVICLGRQDLEPTSIGHQITQLGIPILWLNYRGAGPFSLLRAVWQAHRALAQQPPDVLQGWMYYGNVLASMLGRLLKPRSIKVAWNIRHHLTGTGDNPAQHEKLRIRLALQLARLPVLQPDLLIYNSHAGQGSHAAYRFKPRREVILTNGVDTGTFKPDESRRHASRQACQVGSHLWVAMVARYHPHKGVAAYLEVVRSLVDQYGARCCFCLAGPGMEANNPHLQAQLKQFELDPGQIRLLGPQQDMPGFLAGLDILVLPSAVDALPNILLEAMASGVTTVAMAVGDIGRILDDDTRLAQPGDVTDLVNKVRQTLDAHLAGAAVKSDLKDRDIILENYDLARAMQRYVLTYRGLLGA